MGFLSSVGTAGVNAMAASGMSADADCADCVCFDDCAATWNTVDDTHGTIVERGDNYLIADAQIIGGNAYLIISTGDPALCCRIASAEILSGTEPTLTGWTDCGVTPTFGVPQHTGLFGYGSYCVDYFQLQSSGVFRVKLTFADCV